MLIIPDVSFYQDNPNTPRQIDFVQMKAAMARGVIIRAGQNAWVDSDAFWNMREADKAGLPFGSYFFYDSRVSPETQVNTWVKSLNGMKPQLGLWGDFEEAYNGAHGKEVHFNEFMHRIEDKFPDALFGIYTRAEYWNRRVKDYDYWARYLLWLAHYGVSSPTLPKGFSKWTLWQFTDNGDGGLYGVESKNIDLNYFNGDVGRFNGLFGLDGNTPAPTPPPTRRVVITGNFEIEE